MKKIKTFKRASKLHGTANPRHTKLLAIFAIEVFRPQARAKAKQHTMQLQLYEEPPPDKRSFSNKYELIWLGNQC
ncbi:MULTISPECIES: hypothetical protein [unclassified Paenibacillus]|uniref:hypothetical protein n=1 Tax=unclassified Paenibacillus TaxID=185978 RepID=UPI002F41E9C3